MWFWKLSVWRWFVLLVGVTCGLYRGSLRAQKNRIVEWGAKSLASFLFSVNCMQLTKFSLSLDSCIGLGRRHHRGAILRFSSAPRRFFEASKRPPSMSLVVLPRRPSWALNYVQPKYTLSNYFEDFSLTYISMHVAAATCHWRCWRGAHCAP